MSSVIMIGGGLQEIEAVREAQSLGLKVIVTDKNIQAPCVDVADVFWRVDGRDVEGLVARALFHKKEYDIRGVFTLTELVTSVAVVAQALVLPGVPISSAVACQNKALSKKLWLESGIPSPQAWVVASEEDAVKRFKQLGRTLFIKANVGFGGQGCTKVKTTEDLHKVFHEAHRASADGRVLMEEYVEGSMHDVNGIFDGRGRFHPAGIADRFFHPERPIEVEARCPSRLLQTQEEELLALVERAARALGITFGPVKADAVLTREGFKILEMAPRLHGPRGTLWLTPLAQGFRPLEAALSVQTGNFLSQENLIPRFEKACIYKAILPAPGRVVNITGMEDALKLPGIEKILMFVQEGAIIPEYENSTHVPGYVYATGDTLDLAEKRLNEAIERIRIETL